MFNKLLSNLPYNPSLIHQVSFYAKRLRQESSIRRMGFVFMLLAMSVQVFALISPAQPTLANSSNDIIWGGIGRSKPHDRWLYSYRANADGIGHTDIKAIFDAYNISEADVSNATLTRISSSDRSLYSLGRNPHSALDQPINIQGNTYYERPLHTWGDNSSYWVLQGSRSAVLGTAEDKYFAIMVDCGNIVVKKRDKPNLAIAKVGRSYPNGSRVRRSDVLVYRIFFSNTGAGNAHMVGITDILPEHTRFLHYGRGNANSIIDNHTSSPASPFLGQPAARYFGWNFNVMPAQTENWYVDITVQVNSNAPDGARICNVAYIRSIETPPIRTNQPDLCYTVEVADTPRQPSTPDNPSTPVTTIPVIDITFPIITAPAPTPSPVVPVPQPGQPNISHNKRVSNLTKGVNDAHNTIAAPGDILQYQVLTINGGDAAYSNYDQLKDNVRDILEYGEVVEISDNGVLKNGIIVWKTADIDAQTTLTRTFKVKIKSPVPATPRSASDPQSFDLRIDNTYGNTVSVRLPSPTAARTVELASAQTLPNTGPGTVLVIGFVMTGGIGYFFARNKLMATELSLVRTEQTSGGM